MHRLIKINCNAKTEKQARKLQRLAVLILCCSVFMSHCYSYNLNYIFSKSNRRANCIRVVIFIKMIFWIKPKLVYLEDVHVVFNINLITHI